MNLLLDLTPGATFGKLGLQKGDPFERDGAALRLGPLRILLSGAKTWNPVRPVLSAVDAETLPRRMEWLSLELEAHHDAPGLGRLTPLALDETASDPLPALAARALPFALSFSEGLDKDNCALLREGAQGLVGLGPGLTPAGDDFLGGWLTALRSAEGWGFSRDELNRAAGEVRAAAAGRTTMISEALLGCALDGASSESVHNLLNVLLPETGGSGPDVLARAVREVSRRGHSSGWDALAGIAWGLRSLLDRLKKANARPEIQPSGSSAIR